MQMDAAALHARVEKIRARLLTARASRPAPARDGKVITAWNALAITAFAEAGAALGRADYTEIARCVRRFPAWSTWSATALCIASGTAADARIIGFLDDVANLGAALLTLYEATGEPRYFTAALAVGDRIVDAAQRRERQLLRYRRRCRATDRSPAHHRRQSGERRTVGCGGVCSRACTRSPAKHDGTSARWRLPLPLPPWLLAHRSPSRDSRPRWSCLSVRCARSPSSAIPPTHGRARC